jgi:hypothetical protein
MADLDCSCERAAAELIDRAREQELMVAHLRATLPVMQEIAADHQRHGRPSCQQAAPSLAHDPRGL